MVLYSASRGRAAASRSNIGGLSMRRIIMPLAAFALFLTTSVTARAEEQFQKASVSTTGEAIVYVKPDEVVLNFGVETFDTNLEKAKQQNDAASARLVKAVKD